jgi:hypothetical protein
VQATSRGYTKSQKLKMFVTLEKAKRERKCKRLKLGGGQAYDCSSDWAAVVTGAA